MQNRKSEYDPVAKAIRFDRMLFSSVHYPSDYGFILDTLAGEEKDRDRRLGGPRRGIEDSRGRFIKKAAPSGSAE